VDDEATRALVTFYELWSPKDASRGLPRRDHPDHPEWKHPGYWAAWQLRGLPD
jgi:CHAT domain-containing protein